MARIKASSIFEMVVATLIILISVSMAFQVPNLKSSWGSSVEEIRLFGLAYLCDTTINVHIKHSDSITDDGFFNYRIIELKNTQQTILIPK